ncbi:hypothetical protein DRY87_25895 [Salmonella enterica subsp. enterica serovar Newport]|nr:hypothetical protein [Salmonella enterica subsp. enterica serovar Newport]
MKHQTREQLETIAKVDAVDRPPMTRTERLGRWAELLERDPGRRLVTLLRTEHMSDELRDGMRSEGSPISVAFDDPILRAEGLGDDSYGEAKRFFELSDGELHNVLCYCHFGSSVASETAARHVRAVLTPGPMARLQAALQW